MADAAAIVVICFEIELSPVICEVSHLYETHAGKDKEGDYPQKGAQMRAD